MQYKSLDEIDLKLHLLSGSSIAIDNLEIKPYTLKEVKNYGYNRYMENLQWLSVTVEDFIKSMVDIEKRMSLEAEKSKLKTFDFFISLGGRDLLEKLFVLLAMIFRTDDIQIIENNTLAIDFGKLGIHYVNDDGDTVVDQENLAMLTDNDLKLVHRDNFEQIIEVVKFQNYLNRVTKKDEQGMNPADEETRRLIEEMEKNRKRVEQKKKAQERSEKDGNDEVDISDIISAVTAKSNNISKINVWKLTMYQLYDEYSRLELIDNYDFSIKAMMAGADKVDLKHWSSKI